MFKRVLVANRGEIALRVIRACRELGIDCVAVYSEADRNSLWGQAADEAYCLGPAAPAQSYLNIERLIATAQRSACDAVHPGYGFLAENAGFALACEHARLAFIGPSARCIQAMGDKLRARAIAREAGVAVVAGSSGPIRDAAAADQIAKQTGYPVAVKASAGGGGKGLRIAHSPAELEQAVSLAGMEAATYFSDPTIYLERYLLHPKHVEVQVVADRWGGVTHCGARDCSLQRRHQKLVEETPPCIAPQARERLYQAALLLSRAIAYDNLGTVEFLVDGSDVFFLEMNTRVQVEHTITEAIYGLDLVKTGIRIAAGERLWFVQDELTPRGHAIECRINAEDPWEQFSASPGRLVRYIEPGGPGIRVDSAAFCGWEIGREYDSLVAKLIAWGIDRHEARLRMLRALKEYTVEGVRTTIPLYLRLLDEPSFVDAGYTTATVGAVVERCAPQARAARAHTGDGEALPLYATQGADSSASFTVEVNDKRFQVRVAEADIAAGKAAPAARRYHRPASVAGAGNAVVAPMHGILAQVKVSQGDRIAAGQVVAIIEAMKMMNEVMAQRPGTVTAVHAHAGQTIEAGSLLLSLDEPHAAGNQAIR